jgi:hypothetical protein
MPDDERTGWGEAGMTQEYPCPCCGYLTFGEPPGSYEICPVCFWEDDLIQLRWPTWFGGANKPSLVEAQRTYAAIGACEERLLRYVRPAEAGEVREAGWRPVAAGDDFEPLNVVEADWPTDKTVLYWWRPTFWRSRHSR